MTNEQIKQIALACGFNLREQPDGTRDLNPYVYTFARELIKQNQQSAWVSAGDKLPKGLTPVIAYPNENDEVFYSFFREPDSFGGAHPLVKVTHWQPLPEPPKDKS